MKLVPHEKSPPFWQPSRMFHVRKPGGTDFVRGRPELIFRPGLLGVAPGMHIPRPPSRNVHPLHVYPPPDMMVRQQEHVRPPLEPVPLYSPVVAEDFFQISWLKGIQSERIMSFPHNHGAKKYRNVGRLKNGSNKVDKKGMSFGKKQTKLSKELENVELEHKEEHVEANKKTETILGDQLVVEKDPKDQHIGTIDKQSSLETEHGAEQMDEKTFMEDLEEGEISVGLSEWHVNLDVNENSKQIDNASEILGDKDESSLNFVAVEIVDNIDSENDVGSSGQIEVPIETSANEHRETSIQLTHGTSSAMKFGPKTQEESVARITTEQILATVRCVLSENTSLALVDKGGDEVIDLESVAERLLPFLLEFFQILESFEKENNSSKSRDPRRNMKALCLEEVESCSQQIIPARAKSIGKRNHEAQEEVFGTSAKRLRIEKEATCLLNLDNRLSLDGLYQEPVDMEIDNVESVTYTAIETCSKDTSEIINKTKKDTEHSGSEHTLDVHPIHSKLRPRDPRRSFVDMEKVEMDNVCARKTLNQFETPPRAADGESALFQSSNTLSLRLCEGVVSLDKIHTEGLTDHQLQAMYAERARRIDEQRRMLDCKKLCLVLDLDHTLLNSAKFSEVDKFKATLCKMESEDRRNVDNRSMRRDLYCYPNLGMWTKLRPGVRDFLSRASELYELHVYTMGNKAYATEMTKLLDPTGSLFAGRVISRGDDSNETFNCDTLPKSKDLDGVLGLESAIIIIDDSMQVWPHHRQNLLLVERYMYFPSSRRQFGLCGPSLMEIQHDERAVDGMLASVLKMIEKVHHNFFASAILHDMDVRRIIVAEKQNILAGCKIVFSRVFPQGESNPHLHPLWKKAEQFGAVCTTTIDDEVTHVVAISRGTDKVKWAMRMGRFSVCPKWIEASAVLYRRANESDFPVPL